MLQQDNVRSKLQSSTDDLGQSTRDYSDLDRIMADLPNGFATFDREWRYTYANNRLLNIFKLSRTEVLGRKAWEVFPHQVGIDHFDRLNHAMTERVETQFEFYYELADCWVEHRVYPTADGLAILMADISDRKQTEFRLIEQQRLLQESAAVYHNLFDSIDEGFCIVEVMFDAHEKPVDYRFLQANPAFIRLTGFPADAVGKTAYELVPDLEPFWLETYRNILLTGESVRFENESVPMSRWFDVYASRVGDATSRRVAIVFTNITERKQAEKLSQRVAKFDAFRIVLADALRPLADPVEIQETASRLLGEHLGANRVLYFEIIGPNYVVQRDYVNGVSPLAGDYPIESFRTKFLAAYRSGQTISEFDIAADPDLSSDEKANYVLIQLAAYIISPLVKDGEWVGGLAVQSSTPRVWTPDEVAIVDEVAERTWAALAHARTEAEIVTNLRHTQLLRELGIRLVIEDDPQTLYRDILTTAIALTDADAGTVQILDERSQDLLLIETQGFERKITDHFYRVNAGSNTSCGLAMRNEERVFVNFEVPEHEDPSGAMRMHVEAGYLSAQSTPLVSRTGKPLGMVSTHWRSRSQSIDRPSNQMLSSLDLLARQAADLIEHQQTAAALRESEAKLRMASDAARTGMWFWNMETDDLTWTDQCKALFGLPADTEMSYEVFLATLHPDDRDLTHAAINRAVNDRADIDLEYRCCWPDGSVHWIAAKGSCTYDRSNKAVRMMGVTIDITALKQAQIELQQSSAILNTINQSTPTLIFVKDRQGRLQMGNPAFMRAIGKLESKVIGHTDDEFLLNPDEAAVIRETDRQVMETGLTQVLEEQVELPGGCGTFLSIKSPYVNETGTIVGIVGIAFDITDRKQMEITLAERNQELDSFVHIVSHDLKAPLRAISNLSEWIEDDLGSDLSAEIQQQMSQLRNRVQRMGGMIDGLLDYARVGRTEAQIELVSVPELLAEILDSLAPPPTFEIMIAPDLPTFHTKPLLLSQVFANLISNAFKHNDQPNGVIKISCQERGDFYEFTIADNGPGIALEQRDRIFIIFQSINPKKNSDSTGIGLSIVKKIVESIGGRISLESEVGQGTAFYFTWPKK